MTLAETDATLELLADVAAGFATRDSARVRALRDGGGDLDRAMWRRFGENGWLGILVPEELGGAGLGVDAVAIVARRLGYAAFPEPFVGAGVLAPVLLAEAQDDGCAERLAVVLEGELVVGVGWQGDVVARSDGVFDMLAGTSRFVGLARADAYLVAARGEAGTSLYWVPAGAAGLGIREERCADGTLSAALALDEVRAVPLIAPERGGRALDAALDTARVAVAAELVGVMDAALELTLGYLRQRKQFGRPIGTFQALQHRAVDAWIQRELAAAALEAAVRVHVDPASSPAMRAQAASSAKARAARAAPLVCNAALQLHGAIGYTDEYDLGLYLNRALTLAPWLGGASEHTRRYARLAADATR